ncbi:MAG: 2-C-methyl-D-erythritol 4-phosphate cytidylyltransferase [Clostridiales bacterium]|nr:2-C-methyl-D-erythritol 4-phosphate cytidylyltransferase [Clostridiales bacterium]
MVIAAIMAGGTGSRMGSTDTPKQFMKLGTKPIIIHTIEKFFYHPEIEKIVVPCPKPWIGHTRDIVEKYFDTEGKIYVIEGGASRNDTLMNALDFIESNFGMDDDTIIVTHDAVRPFLTHRIITDNIRYAREYGACDTVVPATDTIVHSEDGKLISDIPSRIEMYQGQTPQSFRAKKLKMTCESLTEEEKAKLTDACMVFTLRNERVSLVEGEVFNIKITYPYDLKVAQVLLQEECNN